jgi:hypothetical protein
MTNAEIENVLLALRAAFPQQELTDEIVALWRNALSVEKAERVEAAVMLHIEREDWWPTIAGLRELIREVAGEERRSQLDGSIRCSGYGWINDGDQAKPCPTCNPALWRVFRDEQLLASWRHGQQLHSMFDMKRADFVDEWSRPPCPQRESADDEIVSPKEGRLIALRALQDSGVPITEAHRRTIGGIGR